MTLTPGTRIGPYEVVAMLGAGGMGEVYRGRDPKLQRDVALKILPEIFAADRDRLARFEREARTLAALNHPHIAGIYGFEESHGIRALALEFVDGETVADRIARGPIPIDEALPIARQIAAALAAAHEHGIVHRDLKPANIKIRPDGTVKILDFGLAKALEPAAGSSQDAQSPTITSAAIRTGIGVILGTAAYMAPEQAKGRAADKRADIWAFGCVLFEMLTGKRPFEGDTISDTMARVLEREPEWRVLPPDTPAGIQALLKRCLRKDPAKRLHDIADALIEIDDAVGGSEPSVPSATLGVTRAPAAARIRLLWMASGVGVSALAIAGALAVWSSGRARGDVDRDSLQLTVTTQRDTELTGPMLSFALAPDGHYLAMVLISPGKPDMLWVRGLRSGEARQLPGTEGAGLPFWSPDSRRIGFFARGKLKTVAVDGSGLTEVCEVRPGAGQESGETTVGASWSQRGMILLWSETGALQKVSATGGSPVPATELAEGESGHGWPAFLPDGEHFLFLAYASNLRRLRVGSVRSTKSTPLGTIRSAAVYASGYMLFVDGGLMAQRFDVTSLRPMGEPQMLVPQVAMFSGRGIFSVSEAGLLVYQAPERLDGSLTWFDRAGTRLATVGERGVFFNLALSPDDQRLAVSSRGPEGDHDIHVIELTRGSDTRRLTTHPAWEHDPAWSPDGSQIVFNSNRGGGFRLFRRPADGSGADELLGDVPGGPPAWSPDGKFILGGGWVRSLEPGVTPIRFGNPGEPLWNPSFSPDGRWIVYTSPRTGRAEIYVRPFPSGDRDYKVSVDGGDQARWRSLGEIFFLSLDGRMMAASVTGGKTFESAIPQQLFATGIPPRWFLRNDRVYDVTRDGRRFILPVMPDTETTTVTLLTNWTGRLPK